MRKIKVALAGNPNSGKTSIFNSLTGTHQRVGNWPGVTVEKKEGELTYKGYRINLVDLPGTYTLSASTIDEKIARDFILNEHPDLIIVVIDTTNLSRSLFLVTELLELNQRLLIALNMYDMFESAGGKLNISTLEDVLDCTVVKTVASRGIGIEELKSGIITALNRQKRKSFRINYGRIVEDELEALTGEIKVHNILPELAPRWVALKLLENDECIIERVKQSGFIELVNKSKYVREKIEARTGIEIYTHIVERKYSYIEGVIREAVIKNVSSEQRYSVSDKIDKVLTHKYFGIPIFLLVMFGLFQLVFTVGNPLAELIDSGFSHLSNFLREYLSQKNYPLWFISFLIDGVISGVGTVLVFLPNIALMFLGIGILEDIGYMARAAFIVDKAMHTFGLHGKSFISFLLGFGCNVPAIMSTRTLETEKDRIITILVLPLMSCSARLPIYILFVSAFFKKYQALIILSLYILGIVIAVIMAKIFKFLFFKKEEAPLIIEIPPYRLPHIKNVLITLWIRIRHFLERAGTIILMAVVGIWFLAYFPVGEEYASRRSIIGHLGSFIAPLLKPAGFGYWQIAVALIFGILAKEVVVGTLGTLLSTRTLTLQQALHLYFSPLSAYSFMVMSLLYIPCIATIATIKKEAGWKWTLLTIFYTIFLGWLIAVIIYQIGKLL